MTLVASSQHEVEESGARRGAVLAYRQPGVAQETLAPGAAVVQMGVVQVRVLHVVVVVGHTGFAVAGVVAVVAPV